MSAKNQRKFPTFFLETPEKKKETLAWTSTKTFIYYFTYSKSGCFAGFIKGVYRFFLQHTLSVNWLGSSLWRRSTCRPLTHVCWTGKPKIWNVPNRHLTKLTSFLCWIMVWPFQLDLNVHKSWLVCKKGSMKATKTQATIRGKIPSRPSRQTKPMKLNHQLKHHRNHRI